MASVDDSRRRFTGRFHQTQALRGALFEELRTRPTYRNAVARLGSSWKRARQGGRDNRLFFELAALASGAPSDSLDAYVDQVRRVVSLDFRMMDPDRLHDPVEWACNYLHCDVEPDSGQGVPSVELSHVAPAPRLVEVWTERATLELVVSPLVAAALLVGDDGAPADQFTIRADGYGDADWKQLGEKAHVMLEGHLRRMRQSYEANNRATGQFTNPNPTRQRQEREDMALLAEWYLGNRAPDRTTRERLRARANLLDLAFPPPDRRTLQEN